MQDQLVGHISRNAKAVEAREKPQRKRAKPKKRGKRGRPRKGEESAKEPRRLERKLTMTLPQMLADLPKACDVGTKRDAKGHTRSWIGYKLHIATADGGIPISCIMTSASTHDSQAAIPLGTRTAGWVENLYDLMDSAYDSIEIRARTAYRWATRKAQRTLGLLFLEEQRYADHGRQSAPLDRHAGGVEAGEEGAANARPPLPRGATLRRALDGGAAEGRLKDEFGGRHVRVRGHDKVFAYLMFGMTALAVSQLMRLIIPPI